jgi:serine/threonine-protein kinase
MGEAHRKVEELFYQGLGLDPKERAAFVAHLWACDPVLGAELESLFAAHESDGDFLNTPAYEAAAELLLDSTPQFPKGHLISRYEILALLDKGGMGEVYLAKDRSLDRKVAIKILPSRLTGDKDRLRRFKQEARAASALNHPNIITIHEIGEEGGSDFIAMEYVEGRTLRKHLTKSGTSIAELLNVVIQAAEALAAAHGAGIIHRDNKPENIKVRADGYVKVLDFGLAKLSEPSPSPQSPASDSQPSPTVLSATEPGTLLGTVNYMSPEQARGLVVDARTDIFSLGVVMYEMASGSLPFRGETSLDVLVSLLEKDPPALADSVMNIPAEFERVINKALSKEREQRYLSARELLFELKSLKEDLKFQARLERSSLPDGDPGKPIVDILQARTHVSEENKTTEGSVPVSTEYGLATSSSSAAYIAGKVRRHKREFIAVLLFLILGAVGLSWWSYSDRAEHKRSIESIAVLPFINESGSADLEYLSDGMTETLISSLSHLQNISVKARSSVFRYKGKEIDPKRIGHELSAQAILTGRVRQGAEQLKVSLELVDAVTENVLWSQQYQRRQGDLASLQNEIAIDVLEKLRQKLTDADEIRLEKRHTDDTEAYHLYLQGRYQWNKRTKESLRRAVEHFQQAIDKDPGYALAYSGLADCYTVFTTYELAPPAEAYTKARMAAQKALGIDPTLGEAYATLADVKESFDWDFGGAERDYQKAIALAPNYATAHQWYGELLRKVGRLDEAVVEQRRAQELDPVSLIINGSLGLTLFYARRYDEAIIQLRKTIDLDANFALAPRTLGWCYTMKGMYTEAVAEHQKAVALSNGGINELAGLAYTLAKSDKRSQARKILGQLNERQKREYVDRGALAKIHFALGEKEAALADLEKAYQEKSTELSYIKVNPAYDDEFRSDPRFQELLRKVGLR